MASAAAALIARARREIQHHFFAADAVRPDRAVPFEPSNGFERRQFDRLRRLDIVREQGSGKYWLDVVAYDVDLRERHRRLRIVLLTIIGVLIVVLVLKGFEVGSQATLPAVTH